jgi:acyl-CoA synthetase (AMP-forming)/AMP-acid ligase II
VRAVAGYLELTPQDGAPVFTPPCYAYSLSQNLVTTWTGGRLLPVASGLLFPMEILRALAQERLTGLSATPTAFRLLCQLDYDEALDLSSVRYAMLGGQFLDPHLVGLTTSLFPNARVVNMYGCTENCPRISYHYVSGTSGLSDRGYYPVGRPVEGTEIQIVGEDGAPVVPGEKGEVLIRGTSLMRRYWKDPEATAARLADGWFHTKDLGFLDAEKRLHLSGRLAIVINIGNEKVSPEEVEAVIGQVEGVMDAAVFGRPDPVLGQTVHAVIVTEPGSVVDVADIQRHCRRELSGYKVPRGIEFVEDLPRTHYGKIDRMALAEMAGTES